ncbi:MAG: biopolymer transporter ExbD [Nitrospirota bacterium]
MADRKYRLMSEINMVPFVDIVLVLLIIFMVSAPLMYRGIDVDLPQSSVNTIKQEQRIMLIVDRFSNIYVDGRKVQMNRIGSEIMQKSGEGANVTVYLKADRAVPYGTIVSVMDIVKGMGIEKLGMVTEPLIEVE